MANTQIDILRHGLPEGGHRYRGDGLDDPLSDIGWRQMWAAVGDDTPWDAVVSSPMARCHPFAEQIAQRGGLPLTVDKRLREVGFGAWEGKTGDQIRAADPLAMQRFYADPETARPAGAEPLSAFRQRVAAALEEVFLQYAGRHVLIVSHAGVMRATISWLMGAPLKNLYRMDIPNAAILRLRSDKERPPMMVFQGPTLE